MIILKNYYDLEIWLAERRHNRIIEFSKGEWLWLRQMTSNDKMPLNTLCCALLTELNITVKSKNQEEKFFT